MRVQTKPIPAEAHLVTVDNMHDLSEWAEARIINVGGGYLNAPERFVIEKKDGFSDLRAAVGDWIIRRGKEYLALPAEEFESQYTLTDNPGARFPRVPIVLATVSSGDTPNAAGGDSSDETLLNAPAFAHQPVAGRRVTPSSIKQLVRDIPRAVLIDRDAKGNPLPPLEMGVRFPSKDKKTVVALIGDWVIRDHLNEFVCKTHKSAGVLLNVPDTPDFDCALANRDSITPQHGFSEHETMMLAVLQAIVKIAVDDNLYGQPIIHTIPGKCTWSVSTEDGKQQTGVNMVQRIKELYFHCIMRACAVMDAQSAPGARSVNWHSLSLQDQTRRIFRVLGLSNKVINPPGEYERAFLKNHALAQALARPGTQVGKHALVDTSPDSNLWITRVKSGVKDTLYRAHVHAFILESAQDDAYQHFMLTSTRPRDIRGQYFSMISPLEHEQLVFKQLKAFAQSEHCGPAEHGRSDNGGSRDDDVGRDGSESVGDGVSRGDQSKVDLRHASRHSS